MLDVLQHIHQDDVFTTNYDESFQTWTPWEHKDDFNHKELLEDFFELWHHYPMHDDEVFTVMYDRHEQYVLGLARLFYFAKDWNTFQHVVFWARVHVNKQLFVYVLTAAAVARKDMHGIVLPAIYEIYPWHFFDADTMELAENYKMHGFHNVKKHDDMYNVVIRTNYSNVWGEINYDHSLAYYLEDIGMNSFYYYYNIDYPFWTRGRDDYLLDNDRRGEMYFYVHWQLLARYYLERLSNDMGEVPSFNMYEDVEAGHLSNLHYHRGVAFPIRDNYHNFYDTKTHWTRMVELYGHRIMNWIQTQKEYTPELVNQLGNMVQGNMDSIDHKFYGSLDRYYHHIVNYAPVYGKNHERLPTTLMHYETSLRDPLFYEMYKEIVHFFWHMMDNFPEYTKKDLTFEGVKINAVNMPTILNTFFESFDADISNAVDVDVVPESGKDTLVTFGRNSHHMGTSFVIKARQHRLNHQPFEFKVDVTSDKAQKAVVKIFLGPKYDENGRYIPLHENFMNFFEMDHFVVDLVAGANTITRKSHDFTFWVNDRTTYLELYRKVMDATNTDYQFPLDQSEAHCGVPRRMMLPKGKKGGMPVQFFFMVYPFHKPKIEQFTGYDPVISCGIATGARDVDSMPFGFPFNRPVHHDYYFDVDNFKFFDTTIYHKQQPTNAV